jgi:signal transduction histidine kinase
VAFERVVGNLIANALKYGAPPVVVRAAGDGGPFRLFVEDRGPGVPPDFVPQLFERFTRADHGTRGGAGLGLAIARWIVELHGGDIRVARNEPHGCRMIATIPGRVELSPLPTPQLIN